MCFIEKIDCKLLGSSLIAVSIPSALTKAAYYLRQILPLTLTVAAG